MDEYQSMKRVVLGQQVRWGRADTQRNHHLLQPCIPKSLEPFKTDHTKKGSRRQAKQTSSRSQRP